MKFFDPLDRVAGRVVDAGPVFAWSTPGVVVGASQELCAAVVAPSPDGTPVPATGPLAVAPPIDSWSGLEVSRRGVPHSGQNREF